MATRGNAVRARCCWCDRDLSLSLRREAGSASNPFTLTKETIKYKNIKRDPRVSVVVDDVLDHHSVIAKGKAAIQEQDIWDMTRKIVYKYYGQEEGDPYLEQLKKQNRVLIVFKPQKMQTWGPVPREATKP